MDLALSTLPQSVVFHFLPASQTLANNSILSFCPVYYSEHHIDDILEGREDKYHIPLVTLNTAQFIFITYHRALIKVS